MWVYIQTDRVFGLWGISHPMASGTQTATKTLKRKLHVECTG